MNERADFWSRRRAGVAAEQLAGRDAEQKAEVAKTQAELEALSDAEILEELGLDDPDTMEPGDDFSQFLAKAVPERLRKRALRKLWRSNSVLACVDGLNDYDLDYTNAATDAPGVATAYQVGKGMLEHVLELARKAEAAAAAEANPEDVEPEPEAEPEVAEEEALVAYVEPVEKDETADLQPDLPPRRMRFQFEEGTA